ncbi:MAG TPA: hypothetical protein VHU87_01840 [Rhizomicrobium sp.]|jgi:hypothetical protein|nr:hypothetical protein [Rhizomicrobium sp.]
MSKIGVGVGDDFPVDDGNGVPPGGQQGPGGEAPRTEADDRADYEDWKRRRDEWRSQRDASRAQREAWRAGKRAFKEKVRAAARESFGHDWDPRDGRGYDRDRRSRHWGGLWLLIPILCIVAFFSLISAVFKAPFLFLGLIAICAIAYGHHHNLHRFYHRYDYGMPRGPIVTPPPSPQQPSNPPPAVIDGK